MKNVKKYFCIISYDNEKEKNINWILANKNFTFFNSETSKSTIVNMKTILKKGINF